MAQRRSDSRLVIYLQVVNAAYLRTLCVHIKCPLSHVFTAEEEKEPYKFNAREHASSLI